uniref:Mos1 transposase HTH domain-containing protein n=1 Tax=Globodera rostochiensis TaxID=31243 RepID=A0A914IEN7_GLORO
MDQTEEYAIRALLRHYWKKGLVAEATVREICAVEGPGTVDIEMARNWFALFESGHTRLEPKKTIWLPSETWEDVFKFVQFRYLYEHIPTTCRRFWALAEPILNGLCPRVAKRIKICWESEELLRRFERGEEIEASAATDLEFQSLEQLGNGNLLRWEWSAFPSDQPPPNIIGFQSIIIQGQIDRQLLLLLQKLSTRIDECQLDFNDAANFMDALAYERISLDEFFASISRCSHMILYRQVAAEFISCPYVLRCPSIEMHWLEFEPQSVMNWLKTVSGCAKKSLTIYGYYCGASTAEPVNVLLATLISEFRAETVARPEFVLELCDFEELFLAEFEDNGLELARLSETNWRLISRSNADQNNEQQNDEEETVPICSTLFRIIGPIEIHDRYLAHSELEALDDKETI